MNFPPRILFVDDHQDTLDLFALVLSQQNYDVMTASSADRALAEATTQHFDLLIFDSLLGDDSGVDLCKKIRETDARTPILFCSGLGYEKDKQEALSAGAQGFLVKPVSIAEMCETVRELISVSPYNKRDRGRKASRDSSESVPAGSGL
jgi:DNA-binding response OmpR family regulator